MYPPQADVAKFSPPWRRLAAAKANLMLLAAPDLGKKDMSQDPPDPD